MKMSFEEFSTPPTRILSKAQERRLNRKYTTGDCGHGSWSTVLTLIRLGYLEETGGNLVVTEKGTHYCHHHGPDMPI